ncbi:MAG: hypothetical protein Q4A17_07605 [Thermoguttaceae bacterium]|nr:hypothetical protein [Thermoguttaceae bacterium]
MAARLSRYAGPRLPGKVVYATHRQQPPPKAACGSRITWGCSPHDRHDGTQTRTQGRLCGRGDADLKNAAKTARYKARRPTFHDRQTAKQRTGSQTD